MIITFDWSDCAGISGLEFSHGVKDNYFWFRIRKDNVSKGAYIKIDPSTVGTSTIASGRVTDYPYQRKTFWAQGRTWVWYANGTYLGFRSSTDGSTWSDWTGVRANSDGEGRYFSVSYDNVNNKVAYAYHSQTLGDPLLYRQGTPNSDGTINWDADEQTPQPIKVAESTA